MFALLKFIITGAGAVMKIVFIMGIGTILLIKPPFVNTDSRFEVLRSEKYIYQVNYEKDKIDNIEIFDRDGNFKGQYEYNELKGAHKKVVDTIKK
jgi:hypothetical protein